ncbi:MAG: 3-dehydroquinate synthase [Ruminiclostridium sp.]|nr:3-dehydroquinate synthase [Ruminiclostridium sp.]MBQ8842639.1 3-dehydroquinate synthase [Ruminiclostridium sp.]
MTKIRINTSKPYDVVIGKGLLENAGELIANTIKGRKAVIVTDDIVNSLYAEKLTASMAKAGFTTDVFVFPNGEESKSHKTLIELYDFLSKKNITRSDFLVALGGGVVGDLTGFAAATYLRGIDYVQIPTTLLAQVDSSVGGKTAVDIEAGKNLVGAFKQPDIVIADTDTLATLTDDIFTDGMGEVVKYGMIWSKSLFELLKTGKAKENLEKIVEECVDIKRQVVETDEFDTGLRMILNFGHTLGHSIEKFYNYKGFSHGKAVSVGMYLMTVIAEKGGLIETPLSEELKACLEANNMPFTSEADGASLFNGAVNDKKRFSDNINLIICREIGKADIVKMNINDFKKLIGE